jgi:ribosomal protein S18 acetylase RimI-like enzyme
MPRACNTKLFSIGYAPSPNEPWRNYAAPSSRIRPFLFELYTSVREAELALTPWTPEQKHAFVEMQFNAQTLGYRAAHPQAAHEIVCADGREVGRIYWSLGAECLHILDITIAPVSRNTGIGSSVLREILEIAETKPITICVESYNPSLRLFERLGFRVIAQDGFQMLLERPPAGQARLLEE